MNYVGNVNYFIKPQCITNEIDKKKNVEKKKLNIPLSCSKQVYNQLISYFMN